MLDDFATTTASGPTQKPETVPTSSGIDKAAETEALDSDAFAKDLQNQMAALMGSIDESRDIKDHVDNVLGELGDPGNQENSNKQSASASKGEEVFQETIRRTMERLQASSSQAEPATQEEESENFLEQMLKEMQNGELPQDSDEKGLNQMLMGMMEQLTNKEILYDPMKELHEKYPTWMETNREKTKPEDMKRYEEQQTLVRKIVERFERKEYSDSNVADREYIVDHMQQVGDWTTACPLL